jgi:hypothetical protein
MVEFLESLGQQLLDLEPIGEAELVYLMIGHLDRQKDVHLGYVNEMLCKFFLHLKVHRVRE